MAANPEMIDFAALEAQQQADEARVQEEARQAALLSAIEQAEANAYGGDADELSQERARAIDYYLGQPFGNEIEGRSKVVSRDVADTIEWIKPSLMRIFTGGDQVAKFDPVGPEDVEAAQQESDYVNHILQRKNPWFQICYEWFTDALLTRNAYAMAYWQERTEPTIERYRGLTDEQLTMIAMDPQVQVIAHRAYTAPVPMMAPMAASPMAGAMGQAFGVTLHDCDVRRVASYGCTKVHVLPPERCLVASDAAGYSVRDGDFFEYWDDKTISSLRIDGFDVPDDIADNDGGGDSDTQIDQARDVNTQMAREDRPTDPAMRKVRVRMVWKRHDYDGDGIAELRHCIVVGRTFLVNQEVSCIPVACIVPTPMPHRHIGLSLYDAVQDLQLIKSAMLRQVVDNTYHQNNARLGVDKNKVNLDDALVSRPQGLIRVDGPPAEALLPFRVPDTASSGINVIQYLDGIRQYRTGTQQPFVGPDQVDSKALPGTVDQLTAAASQRVELIARVFAEGVKELVGIVHEVTLTNATAIDKIELRGKWVPIDPRQWRKRADMTITVGMGVSNQRRHVESLRLMIDYAKQALPYGLTDLQKIYAMLAELTKALGFAGAERFWTEPQPGAMPAPQPPYQVQVAQINAQAELLATQMKTQADATIQTLKDEAQAVRTFFQEQQESQRQAHENVLRAMSEATDRMQEIRLESARKPAENNVKIAGLGGLSKAVEAMSGAAERVAEHSKAAADAAARAGAAADAAQKPKKRTITTDKGRKYTVEDSQ